MEPSFFTINACNRCRRRKARCDTCMPACSQCQQSGSVCSYSDPHTKETQARSHISDLENQVARLEAQLGQLQHRKSHDGSASLSAAGSAEPEEQQQPVNAEAELAHPDMIQLESGEDAHYLGASSGMGLARSILQSTQRNDSFNSGVKAKTAHHQPCGPLMADREGNRQAHSVSAGNALPSKATAIHLVDVFFSQYQIQYPILERPEFMRQMSDLYSAGERHQHDADVDARTGFMLRLVLAISLQLLSQEEHDPVLELAESFRLSALSQLSYVMQVKCSQTLQCLLLLLLSSLLSSRSAPMWYISGLCMRMCVDLGYHSERTIRYRSSESEMDRKRRLFWVTYTFECSLATMLGRPFFLDDDKIDVQQPSSSLPSSKRAQSLHWLKLQRMQSGIVQRLHASASLSAKSDRESAAFLRWRADMTEKLKSWQEQSLKWSGGGGDGDDDLGWWWRYWYHNAMLMLHRPLSNDYFPSTNSLLLAFESAKSILQLSFIRANKSLSVFTWLDLHYQIVSGLTLLFLVLKSPDVRSQAQRDWISFNACIAEWQVVLQRLCQRWSRMNKTKDVLAKLADATLDIVEQAGRARPTPSKRLRQTLRHKQCREAIIKEFTSSAHTLTEYTPSTLDIIQDSPDNKLSGFTSGETSLDAAMTRGGHSERVNAGTAAVGPDETSRPSPSEVRQPWQHDLEGFDLSYMLMGENWAGLTENDLLPSHDLGAGGGGLDNNVNFLGPFQPLVVPNYVFGNLDAAMTDSVLNFGGLEDVGERYPPFEYGGDM